MHIIKQHRSQNIYASILDRIIEKYDLIKMIYEKYNATSQFTIVSYNYVANIGYWLSEEVISKLNKLNASLDIDIYNLK